MNRWLLALFLFIASPVGALPPGALATIDVGAAAMSLPAGALLRDERGNTVALGAALAARPALVVLGYYGCSNLCSMVLQGVRHGLHDAGLHAGRDVDIVVISIAPQETPAMARAKRRDVFGDDTAPGWHFFTAEQSAIDAVTRALGYRYAWDDAAAQFAHPAGIAVVGTDGRVRAMLSGVAYPPAQLGEAVAGAKSAVQRPHAPWLLCFGLDPQTGRYTPAALLAVRTLGIVTLCAMVLGVVLTTRRVA